MGSPPAVVAKNSEPNCRSKVTMNKATAMIGSEKRRRNEVMVVIQANTGIRRRRIPLALMLKTVTTKFTEDTNEARPTIWRPRAQ